MCVLLHTPRPLVPSFILTHIQHAQKRSCIHDGTSRVVCSMSFPPIASFHPCQSSDLYSAAEHTVLAFQIKYATLWKFTDHLSIWHRAVSDQETTTFFAFHNIYSSQVQSFTYVCLSSCKQWCQESSSVKRRAVLETWHCRLFKSQGASQLTLRIVFASTSSVTDSIPFRETFSLLPSRWTTAFHVNHDQRVKIDKLIKG